MRLWAAFLRFNRVRNGRTTVFLSGNMQIRFLFVSTSGYVPPFLQGVKSQWSTCLDLVSGPGCPDKIQAPSMMALLFRTAMNRDMSTGPLTRLFAHSLALLTHSIAPHCLLHSHAPLRSFVCSVAHLLTPEQAELVGK